MRFLAFGLSSSNNDNGVSSTGFAARHIAQLGQPNTEIRIARFRNRAYTAQLAWLK